MIPISAQAFEDLQKQFQRDINCLSDEDRNIRLRGLTNINTQLFAPQNDQQSILKLFDRVLLKNVLRLMDDKVEKHKAIALDILNKFLDNVKEIDTELISAILKCFVSRMNSYPYPEQGEEMRLKILSTMRTILKLQYNKAFQQNLADIAFMISKEITDQFPDAKKECSMLVIELSNELKDKLGDHAGTIAKSLVKNFAHNHYKVRKITLEASGELLLTHNGGNQMKELLPMLKQVVNDNALDVRRTAYEVIARLLNGFSTTFLKEYEADLVQLLLNGLSDDKEEVNQLAIKLISQVGNNIKKLEMEIEGKKKE